MFDYFNLNNTTDYEYMLKSIGVDVDRNGETIRALITQTELEQNYDDKRISSLSPFVRGDVIDYEGNLYMLISEENSKRYNKWKGIMRRLPHNIKFNVNCEVFSVPSYITVEGFDINSGNIISIPDGKIDLHFPDNALSKRITLGRRFIYLGQVFKVTGINRYAYPGIVIVSSEKDLYNSATDDLVNKIVFSEGNLNCSFKITNTKPIIILKDQTLQLTTNTNLSTRVFESSNPSIATVDSNGLITGIKEGSVTITAYRSANSYFKDTVQVNITLPDKFTIEINPTSGQMGYDEYTPVKSKVFNNGIEIPDAAVTYSIVGENNLVEINQTSNQAAVIHNINKSGESKIIKVRASFNGDASVYANATFNLDYYIAPNYSVVIFTGHQPPHEAAYNEEVFLGKVVYNNGIQEEEHSVIWTLVGEDKVTPVSDTVAKITLEDGFNQIYVHNYNQTGIDTNIYVKAVLDGESSITDYYLIKLISEYVAPPVPAMTITRNDGTEMNTSRDTDDRIVYGNSQSYKITMTPTQQPVTWSIDLNGADSKMATITTQNGVAGTVTIKAIAFAAYPKTIYLVAKLVSDPTITKRISIYVGNFS